MKICYIAHPISGNVDENLADLRRIIRKINLEYPDIVPFCPYYADVVSLNDNDPAERERGIKNDSFLINKQFIDEVWLTGNKMSYGMEKEVALAAINEIPIMNYINQL